MKLGAKKSLFPWEARGSWIRAAGLHRLRPLVLFGLVLALLVTIAVRERRQTGIRRTRAILLDVRTALDAYLADHKGQCPSTFQELESYGAVAREPVDAWGTPLTLICDVLEEGEPYRLVSAGPDGLMGGLDRIE